VANSGDSLYSAPGAINTVTPVNLVTGTAGSAITVGNNPDGIAITPDGSTAYVTNSGGNTVTPINVSTDAPGAPITVGTTPDAIAITPNGSTAYAANGGPTRSRRSIWPAGGRVRRYPSAVTRMRSPSRTSHITRPVWRHPEPVGSRLVVLVRESLPHAS
jgi:YVTN family beta-propeller protein